MAAFSVFLSLLYLIYLAVDENSKKKVAKAKLQEYEERKAKEREAWERKVKEIARGSED